MLRASTMYYEWGLNIPATSAYEVRIEMKQVPQHRAWPSRSPTLSCCSTAWGRYLPCCSCFSADREPPRLSHLR